MESGLNHHPCVSIACVCHLLLAERPRIDGFIAAGSTQVAAAETGGMDYSPSRQERNDRSGQQGPDQLNGSRISLSLLILRLQPPGSRHSTPTSSSARLTITLSRSVYIGTLLRCVLPESPRGGSHLSWCPAPTLITQRVCEAAQFRMEQAPWLAH